LSELYLATDPSSEGRYTVPRVRVVTDARFVTDDFPQFTLYLETRRAPEPDRYPGALRGEVDPTDDRLYHGLNIAVYEAGFARSQEAYEEAVRRVFATLDFLEERLSGSEFLFDGLTESDVRAYTTLARFDTVYYLHFKCSIRRLVDYPAVWRYARRLYAIPAFRETTNFDHIKRHYYLTHPHINPSRLVPLGPELDWSL